MRREVERRFWNSARAIRASARDTSSVCILSALLFFFRGCGVVHDVGVAVFLEFLKGCGEFCDVFWKYV